jgi:hypothetical protein
MSGSGGHRAAMSGSGGHRAAISGGGGYRRWTPQAGTLDAAVARTTAISGGGGHRAVVSRWTPHADFGRHQAAAAASQRS